MMSTRSRHRPSTNEYISQCFNYKGWLLQTSIYSPPPGPRFDRTLADISSSIIDVTYLPIFIHCQLLKRMSSTFSSNLAFIRSSCLLMSQNIWQVSFLFLPLAVLSFPAALSFLYILFFSIHETRLIQLYTLWPYNDVYDCMLMSWAD